MDSPAATEVPDPGVCAELTELAQGLLVEAVDLDDSVRDVTDRLASAQVNADTTFADVADAQDRFYGLWDERASAINNSGVPAQVAFLVGHLGAVGARSELERVAR